MNTQQPQGFDLLLLATTVDEDVLAALLQDRILPLLFNGRPVWGLVNDAIWKARQQLAHSLSVEELALVPEVLEVAAYHPEEAAIYVGVTFQLSTPVTQDLPKMATADQVVRRGLAPGDVLMEPVGSGTSGKILELMDSIDLKRVIALPY